MNDAPETIWIQTNHNKDCCDLENWDTKPDADEMDYFTGYRRADLPPTLSAAIQLPEVRAALEAAEYFAKNRKSIMADIGSAHSGRGAGASSWMREDDNDFYHGLGKALDDLSVALAQLKGPKP